MEEVLEQIEDIESWSFYGLWHWLSEVNQLLERADHAAVSKAPRAQDLAAAEARELLLAAQARLRRQLGALLEEPLTRRERPLAEEFLQEQISKLQSQARKDERAAAGLERLQQLRAKLTTAPETKAVQDIEAQMKQADAELKELKPIYEKWQQGRHSFRSNSELQAFKRRYEDCQKLCASPQLEEALRRRRGPEPSAGPRSGPRPGPAGQRSGPSPGQLPLDARAKPGARPSAKQRGAKPSSWASNMTLAQRLRAEAAAKVREEALGTAEADPEPIDDGQDDVFWEEMARPPPPPVPKEAATGPAGKTAEGALSTGSGLRASEAAAPVPVARLAGPKKRPKESKAKKKKAEEDVPDLPDMEPVEPLPVQMRWELGTALEDMLQPSAWAVDEEQACKRLAQLERLLRSPLGFRLPFAWARFLALDMDGGPKRRSLRGHSDALERLKHNVPQLLGFYTTVVFLLTVLHSLSHFGLLMWLVALQTALILLPVQRAPAQLLGLQLVHLLLWVFFIRSLWQMHMFIKALLVAALAGHAYAVREVPVGTFG
ncbi:unnamed protein product [Effrenium voratum]|nr:unnamed protein product [Effrenium voratum]